MYAKTKLSASTKRHVIDAFLNQRQDLEKSLPAEKGRHHQFRIHFDLGIRGQAIAIYGGWPWQLFWLHYTRMDSTGIHQIEAHEVKPA